MYLEKQHLNELENLVIFLQTSGSTGYNLLQELSDEPLPDLELVNGVANQRLIFSNDGQEFGRMDIEMSLFGTLDVYGTWDNDVYDFQYVVSTVDDVFKNFENQLHALNDTSELEQ